MSVIRRLWVAFQAAIWLFFLAGCGAAPAAGPVTVSVTAQAYARGAVQVAEQIWDDAAHGCIDSGNAALKAKCAQVLIPARDSLIVAAEALDAWNDAKIGEVACAAQDVVSAVLVVAGDLGPNDQEKAILADAKALAFALGTCNKDGGK